MSWQAIVSIAFVAISLTVTISGALAIHRFEERQLQARLERRADNVFSYFSEKMSPISRAAVSLKILFENSSHVSATEFKTAADTLLQKNPEIGIFEWIPRVKAEQRDDFLKTTRDSLGTDFQIVDIDPAKGRVPAPVRPESWPITYVLPLGENSTILGFDLRVGPTVETLKAAQATRTGMMAPPRPLVQSPDSGVTLFFIEPVFRKEDPGDAELLGFVQVLANARAAFEPVIEQAEENELLVDIEDVTDRQAISIVSTMSGRLTSTNERFVNQQDLDRYGRIFRFRSAPKAELVNSWQTYYAQGALAGGLAGSLLLALYLQSLLRRTATISGLVKRRTEELTESNLSLQREAVQRRQAESAALVAQESYKFLVDSVDAVVWQADIERDRVVFVNRRAREILGYPIEQWLTEKDFWQRHVHPDDRAAAIETFTAGAANGGTFEQSYRMLAADGRVVWMRDHVRTSHEPGQSRLAHVVSFDITKQRESEELLERDAHFLANVNDALVVTDLAGNVTYWNPGAERTFGWKEGDVIGRSLENFFNPQVAAVILTSAGRLSVGESWSGEWNSTTKDGRRIVLDSRATRFNDRDGRAAGIFTISRDVTARTVQERERAALDAKLQHSQKLESLGVLAGGIAHDFNNILTGILGHSSLLAMDLVEGHPMTSSVRAIEQSALRAAALCQQMLAYAGRGRFVVESVDLGEMVRETSNLFETSVAKNASIEFNLAPGTPRVRADATQMRQVVMNLVMNGAEALGEKGGRLVITTGTIFASRAMLESAVVGSDAPEGEYVFLEVMDTGCGIAPGNLRRIFEPFFSTKFTGRGLGLAAVIGIVKGHDGVLFVSSIVNTGTTFRMLLPPTMESQPPQVSAAGAVAADAAVPSISVLIIDDEELVRQAATTVLARTGNSVETAGDGFEGVTRYAAKPAGFELVLLDLTMPGMHGTEVLAQIRAINPLQRVIVMSGFSADEAATRFGGETPDAFLEKPFTALSLLEVVTRIASIRRG